MNTTKEWYTVDTFISDNIVLAPKFEEKKNALKEYNRVKRENRKADGGRVRLCHHVEQIEVLKDEVVLGKE